MIRNLRNLIHKYLNSKHRRASFSTSVTVGEHTYGIDYKNCLIFNNSDSITVGSYCSIAEDVRFIASGEHFYKRVSTFPFNSRLLSKSPTLDTNSKGKIEIGNDVWIGYGAVVLSGVKIHDGAVIAARAVVRENVPAYQIFGGVPAKKISSRFTDEEIEFLLDLRWWDWEFDAIKRAIEADAFDSVSHLKKYCEQINN